MGDVLAEIETELACSLCLEVFVEPKVLACHHIFCKSCLDELLVFHEDGGATLACPMKCEVESSIDKEKTTNDLMTNIYVAGVVGKIRARNAPTLGRCMGSSDCGKCTGDVVAFCCECDVVLCKNCRNKHGIMHKDHFQSVKYVGKEESLAIVCEEHNTVAKFVCSEPECHSQFLCVYCVERKHKSHCRERIGVRTERVKQWLHSERANAEAGITQLNEKALKDRESIQEGRKLLQSLLQGRAVERIHECLKSVETATRKILDEYDVAVDIHKQSYPQIGVEEFFERFQDADDALAALMEKNAVKYLARLASAKENIPVAKVNLTDPSESNLLGKLIVQSESHRSLAGQNFCFVTGCEDKSVSALNLWEDLENFIGRRSHHSDNPSGTEVMEEKPPSVDLVTVSSSSLAGEEKEKDALKFPTGVKSDAMEQNIANIASYAATHIDFKLCSALIGLLSIILLVAMHASTAGTNIRYTQISPNVSTVADDNGKREFVRRYYPEYKAELVEAFLTVPRTRTSGRERASSLEDCLKICIRYKNYHGVNVARYYIWGNWHDNCHCDISDLENHATLSYKLS